MSEGTLASAVALPDPDSLRQSAEYGAKRRKSSVSDYDSKRRRLSTQDDVSPNSQQERPSSPAPAPDRPAERRPSRPGAGRAEERKRGQRLFGALLGTLSQSSNSAANKRRADIEKRQQDKLKSQAEEYDELKKQRRDRRDAIRKKEQPLYEREAMRTRHSNMVAMAHFLKTKTKPVLCYKPWQLRPGDEAVIREQIEEAEAIVAREVAEFDARYPPETASSEDTKPNADAGSISKSPEPPHGPRQQQPPPPETTHEQASAQEPDTNLKESREAALEASDTVGADTNQDQSSDPLRTDVTPTNGSNAAVHQTEVHRGHDDDGGEVVEDNEDTVIY